MFLCAPSRNIVNASAKLGSKRTLVTGLVGLPNVGKSSLFNALTSTIDGAEAANYPFCTIDPNKGIAPVNDATLDQLATVAGSSKTIPAVLEFLDIAGLVEGASKGEGLGNKFLGNIRECDAIIHVVRCFEDEEIIHVESSVDPKRDAEVINIERCSSQPPVHHGQIATEITSTGWGGGGYIWDRCVSCDGAKTQQEGQVCRFGLHRRAVGTVERACQESCSSQCSHCTRCNNRDAHSDI